MVLLGIHNTLKENTTCSAAELVYGTTLCEFFDHMNVDVPTDPADNVATLKWTMQQLRTEPLHNIRSTSVMICLHVLRFPYNMSP